MRIARDLSLLGALGALLAVTLAMRAPNPTQELPAQTTVQVAQAPPAPNLDPERLVRASIKIPITVQTQAQLLMSLPANARGVVITDIVWLADQGLQDVGYHLELQNLPPSGSKATVFEALSDKPLATSSGSRRPQSVTDTTSEVSLHSGIVLLPNAAGSFLEAKVTALDSPAGGNITVQVFGYRF